MHILERLRRAQATKFKDMENFLCSINYFEVRQAGSHHIFTKEGKKYPISLTNGKQIGRSEVARIYKLLLLNKENLAEKEKEKVTRQFDPIQERPSASQIQSFKDDQYLREKALPDLTKLDLTQLNQQNAFKALSDAHNRQTDYLIRLGSMMQSTQEYLIEIGVKLEQLIVDVPKLSDPILCKKLNNFLDAHREEYEPYENDQLNRLIDPRLRKVGSDRPVKVKLTLEERLAKLKEGQQKQAANKRAQCLQKIKDVLAKNPEYGDNLYLLAGYAGVSDSVIRKYQKEGLI